MKRPFWFLVIVTALVLIALPMCSEPSVYVPEPDINISEAPSPKEG